MKVLQVMPVFRKLNPCSASSNYEFAVTLAFDSNQNGDLQFPRTFAGVFLRTIPFCWSTFANTGLIIEEGAQVCFGLITAGRPKGINMGDAGSPLTAFTSTGRGNLRDWSFIIWQAAQG